MNRNADQLTLHEAMAVALRGRGWVERDTVARELAERELYLRPKDGQPPPTTSPPNGSASWPTAPGLAEPSSHPFSRRGRLASRRDRAPGRRSRRGGARRR